MASIIFFGGGGGGGGGGIKKNTFLSFMDSGMHCCSLFHEENKQKNMSYFINIVCYCSLKIELLSTLIMFSENRAQHFIQIEMV